MDIGERGARTPHGEILRTLGELLEVRAWGDLRLDARPAHLVLEARPVARRGVTERLVLAPTALLTFLHEARTHRGAGETAPTVPIHPARLGYGEALRLIGQELDRRGARLVRVIEHPDGLIVQAFPPGLGLTTVLAPWPRLVAQHQQAIDRRQSRARESA